MPVQTTRPQLAYLAQQLDELKKKGTYFKLRVLEDEQAPECTFDGKRVINLASNNYLGLTLHPAVVEAAREALRTTDDPHLMTTWRLLVAGRVVGEGPRHYLAQMAIGAGVAGAGWLWLLEATLRRRGIGGSDPASQRRQLRVADVPRCVPPDERRGQ